jgi:hypothetical protein
VIQENPLASNSGSKEFIRLCLSSRWNPAYRSMAAELYNAADFEWSTIIDQAQKEHITPLMYRALRDAKNIPPEIIQLFYKDYLWWARRNMLTFHDLGKLLQVLVENDIPVILLKGVALADDLYGNVALRPLSDMDVLAHLEDRRCLIELLEPLNYKLKDIEVHDATTFEYENEIVLVKAGEPKSYLDLHWSLLDSMYYQHAVDLDWFWQTAVPANVDGIKTKILGPEAQLLHLCSHLMIHHKNEGLLWFNDIALFLQRYQTKLNWKILLERAVQYELVWPLQNTILTVVNEWGVDVPQKNIEHLLLLDISDNERRIHERRRMDTRPVARRFYTDLLEIPGWLSKIRYALLHFFPSPAYMKRRYGIGRAYFVPLYYPYRWLIGLASVFKLYPPAK